MFFFLLAVVNKNKRFFDDVNGCCCCCCCCISTEFRGRWMSVSSSEVGDRSLNHAVRQQKEAGRIQLHRTVCFLFFSSHFVSFRFHFSFFLGFASTLLVRPDFGWSFGVGDFGFRLEHRGLDCFFFWFCFGTWSTCESHLVFV